MPYATNQSFDPDFSRGLDIESLISAPLIAVSKANVVMAQGQTRFLLDYCFKKSGENYEPVLIRMAINKSIIIPVESNPEDIANDEISGTSADKVSRKMVQQQYTTETVTTYFDLPLLTIVPLNSLVVDKVAIDFDLEISSYVAHSPSSVDESNNTITDKKALLYGKISHDRSDPNNQSKSQLSSKIKVNLNAATLPLPAGVLSIIDIYNKSIQVTPEQKNLKP